MSVFVSRTTRAAGPLKQASPAILDVFYGGEEAAAAMATVLFGDYNPSGRLPMTMFVLLQPCLFARL
jgi:hypothetical protein